MLLQSRWSWVRQLRHYFGPFPTNFSALYSPPLLTHTTCAGLYLAPVLMLTGACKSDVVTNSRGPFRHPTRLQPRAQDGRVRQPLLRAHRRVHRVLYLLVRQLDIVSATASRTFLKLECPRPKHPVGVCSGPRPLIGAWYSHTCLVLPMHSYSPMLAIPTLCPIHAPYPSPIPPHPPSIHDSFHHHTTYSSIHGCRQTIFTMRTGLRTRAVGVRQLRHHLGLFLTHFSSTCRPTRAVQYALLSAHAHRAL